MFWVNHRFTNVDFIHPGNGDQVTGLSFLNFHPLKPNEPEELGNAEVLLGAVQFHNRNLVPNLDLTTNYAADPNPTNEVVVIEDRHLELEWFVGVVDWCRNRVDDRVK